MNIINNKNRILRIHDLKQHIQCMSHENIAHYAENDPIIPLEKTKLVMSENAGYAGAIQCYCTVINAQPDIQLEEIPSIIPSQQLARENADYWMEELNPKIINTYTQVKQFSNYYASITDEDIELLVNNINDLNGKDNFIAVMNDFQAQSDKNGEQTNIVSSHLNDFDGRLAEDLRNFEIIKSQADALYIGEEGKLQQLQKDMERYTATIEECNIIIAITATLLSIGFVAIVIANFVAIDYLPIPLIIMGGGIVVSGASAGILSTVIQKRQEAQANYQKAAREFEKAQTQCTILQALSDNFTSLGQTNIDARDAVQHMMLAWQTISNNFSEISDVAQEIVNENTQDLIKLKLKEAREDVQKLKAFAEQCELNGILPVIPDVELIYRLRLPQSWLNQAIHGNAFRAYVAAKRKKGFFDRRRRGWRTRDRQICIPLYRTDRC